MTNPPERSNMPQGQRRRRKKERAPEEKEPVSSTGNVPPAQQSINTAQGRAAYHRRSMPCPGTSKDNIPKLPKVQKQ